MEKIKVLIMIPIISMLLAVVSQAGENSKNESRPLYGTVEKIDVNYNITHVSTDIFDQNILLNDMRPTFSIGERSCGSYFANGSPADSKGVYCEKIKDKEFVKIKIATLGNAFLTAFSLGTNIVAGGQHMRYGNFDKAEFDKATEQTSLDAARLVKNYHSMLDLEKEYLDKYNRNLSSLIYNININDQTGYCKAINYKDYVKNSIIPKVQVGKINLPYSEFVKFVEPVNVQNMLQEKYKYIESNKVVSEADGCYFKIDAASTDNIDNPVMKVALTVTDKVFRDIYPTYENSDNVIDIIFNGKNINFTNKTNNYIQVLSVSMYYKDYIKTLSFTNSPLELAPQAKTIEPISVSSFADSKLQGLSIYSGISSAAANKIKINFGFAVKYRVVEQNMDKTLFKTKLYNLHDVLKEHI